MNKQRLLAALLAAVMCILCIGTFAAVDRSYDVNGDGEVGAADLTRLMKFISGQEVTASVTDINGDGKTSASDLTRLMKYIAGDPSVVGTDGAGDTAAEDTAASDTTEGEGGDAVEDAFSAVGKKYLYGEEELVILELENRTNNDYTVSVTVRFFDGSGKELCHETQTCESFADRYKRSFIFRPYESFDSFTYELAYEEYDSFSSEKNVTVSFTEYTSRMIRCADGTDAYTSVANFSYENRNLKTVYFSCYYAFVDESGKIISLQKNYCAAESYRASAGYVDLSDAQGSPILLSQEEYESVRIIPMIYDFAADPFGAGNGYGAETYSPVSPNRAEGVISSPSGKPDPIAADADQVYNILSDSIKNTYHASNGVSITYRMHIPADYSEEYAYPVLTVLHGLGPEGSDGNSHISSYMQAPYHDTASPLYQSIVIYPQCPYDCFTDYGYANNPEMKEQMAALVELMDYINEEYSTNLNRQYLMGYSAGAYAVWELMERLPGRFAAAIPVAGGGNKSKAEALKDTYIYAYHDSDDTVVDPNETREMYLAVKSAGSQKITYTETDGKGHPSILGTLEKMTIYEWLFDKVKE